jgi:hypothetical protein
VAESRETLLVHARACASSPVPPPRASMKWSFSRSIEVNSGESRRVVEAKAGEKDRSAAPAPLEPAHEETTVGGHK